MRGRPFTISINEFIQTGQFGTVKPGMKKDEIKTIFPKPDSVNPMGNGMSIWLYDKLEFHFIDDKLNFIWCDWLEALKSPHKKQFKLDRGLLNGHLGITTITDTLKSWNKQYKAVGYYQEGRLEQIIYTIHSIVLYFELNKQDKWMLIAIGAETEDCANRTSQFFKELQTVF